MILFCPHCNQSTENEVRQWQTERGKFGALSVFCTYCNEVTILNLKDGIKLVINIKETK